MVVITCAVAVLRYAAGVLKWTAKELKELDKQTRKVMTIYVVFTLNRLYMPRGKSGRGLISCERCIRSIR